MGTEICAYCATSFADHNTACPACGMAATPPDRTLPAGTPLYTGKFIVGRVLGAGGFGIYRGRHKALRRRVAIKELFPATLGAMRRGTRVMVPTTQQEDFSRERDSALREAQIIAGFQSQNIVDVHDMFRENNTAYIVMEYLEGQTPEACIQERGAFPWGEVRDLALNLCEALEEVHSHQLLHRDIKPANIMLTEDLRTVLIDFGSARAFQTGRTMKHTRILTEDYATPEQYSQEGRFGPYTDIFGLGGHTLPRADRGSAQQRSGSYARACRRFDLLVGPAAAFVHSHPTGPGTAGGGAAANHRGDPCHVSRHPTGFPNHHGSKAASLAAYNQALRRDPDLAVAYYNRGYTKAALGQYKEAIADYDQVPHLVRHNAAVYCRRGYVKSMFLEQSRVSSRSWYRTVIAVRDTEVFGTGSQGAVRTTQLSAYWSLAE